MGGIASKNGWTRHESYELGMEHVDGHMPTVDTTTSLHKPSAMGRSVKYRTGAGRFEWGEGLALGHDLSYQPPKGKILSMPGSKKKRQRSRKIDHAY